MREAENEKELMAQVCSRFLQVIEEKGIKDKIYDRIKRQGYMPRVADAYRLSKRAGVPYGWLLAMDVADADAEAQECMNARSIWLTNRCRNAYVHAMSIMLDDTHDIEPVHTYREAFDSVDDLRKEYKLLKAHVQKNGDRMDAGERIRMEEVLNAVYRMMPRMVASMRRERNAG